MTTAIDLQIPTAAVFEPLLTPRREGGPRYKGAHGGRGSGKSHFFAGMGVEYAQIFHGLRMLCIREVQLTLRESAKRLIEDKIRDFGIEPNFRILHDQIRTPGNGVMTFIGMQDHTAESIKSYEGYDVAWCEEAQTLSQRSLEMLRPTIRKPGSELWFSWNPRHAADPIDMLLRGVHPPQNSVVVQANYTDNPFFPEDLEEERVHAEKHNRDRYGHIWLGEYEPVAIGAIWSRLIIHQCRRIEAPKMGRIVVAVDPAVSSKPGSDEHGIVISGIGEEDQNGYVLGDWSLQGTPRQWATRAVAAYDNFEADAIVCEINNGGDLVKANIRSVRPDIPVIEVRATRGKHVRAEPISALYEIGRVHHVGTFDKMEDQMCQMTAAGYEGKGSPDRVDALVWGLSELFPKIVDKQANTSKLFAALKVEA